MQTYYPGKDPNIRVYGRTNLISPLPLYWAASGIEFYTDASDCILELSADYDNLEQWIRVEVNDYQVIRMPLNRGVNRILVFQGMQFSGNKKVHLYKEVQPMGGESTNSLFVNKVECNGSLLDLPPFSMRIEFVGDSITSGEGLAGNEKMQDWIASVFSNAGHYALATAKELNADYRLISQSGWGTYCSWDNQPQNVLPRIYDEVCSVYEEGPNVDAGCLERADFDKWKPDVVVINLGTNDEAAFHNVPWTDPETGITYAQKLLENKTLEPESVARFTQAMDAFLRKLRMRNPQAELLWVCGMLSDEMVGDGLIPSMEETIDRYRKETGDTKVHFQKLPDTRPEWIGARMHPGVPSHQETAKVLVQTIRKLTRMS